MPSNSPRNSEFASYQSIREAVERHPVRTAEVPLQHEVSLPVPTMRWGSPVYVVFAMPASRQPGAPKRLGVPDRWWSVDAKTSRLKGYNTVDTVPLAELVDPQQIEIAPSARSLDAHLQDLKALGDLMDAAIHSFVPNEIATNNEELADLRSVWNAVTPREMGAWYAALVPDFFQWLDEGVRP